MQADKKTLEFLRVSAAQFPKIVQLKLFGSRAREDASERSDYDVAVYEGEGPDCVRFYLDVQENLPSLCGINLVKMGENVNAALKERIELEGISIYEKKE